MHMSRKRSVIYLLLIAATLLFAYCLRFVFHPMTDNSLLAISMMTLRWAIQVPLTVLWIASIRRRILNTSIRKMLLAVGGMLLLWQVVRIVKFDYVIVTEPIGRYCWYAYYIPMILVPLIGVFVVNHIGKPEGYRSPAWMKYLFIPALFLLGVVFTNDLHQLVFTFHNGFELYNSDYGYDFMYFVIQAWFYSLTLLFVVRLMLKSRVPGSKQFQKMPLIIAVCAILFWAGYSMKLYVGDLTAIDCIFIIMLLEGAIQSGLIPSNMNYAGLFQQSTIAAQIVDRQHHVHYASSNAEPLDAALLEQARRAAVSLGDSVLHGQEISGGYIFWQDDVKAIHDLAEHLREANDALGESNELLQAEVALKERRLQAEEKTRLYDSIARDIAPQLNKADEILQQSRQQPERAKEMLSQLCVISAYIKRRANLLLLGEEKDSAASQELESCLRETLDNLRLCGVITYLDCHCDGQAGVKQMTAAYDLVEQVVEALLDQLSAMVVTVQCTQGTIHMRVQAGCKDAMPTVTDFSLAGGTVICETQDEDLIVEATIRQGGAAK